MEWKWSLHWGSVPQVMCGSAIIHRWLWITQAEPCYLCTLERHVRTEIPTIRKGNTWVHLRSPRWAMLSWYFTWKNRIGDCLWTWVNICVCCQNKNRRAHKQNKGYMGAMPRGLNKEGGDVHVQSCTHTDTTPPFCTPLSSLWADNGRRGSSLAIFAKICERQGTKSEFWHLLACWEILPWRNGGLCFDHWNEAAWLVSTPISAWPHHIRFVWERSVRSSQSRAREWTNGKQCGQSGHQGCTFLAGSCGCTEKAQSCFPFFRKHQLLFVLVKQTADLRN